MADRYSDKMCQNIKDEIADMDSEDGGFNPGKLWKLKKKLYPSIFDPPSAIKKSRIRETKHLLTDADISTDAIGGWTKAKSATTKKLFFCDDFRPLPN